MERLSPEQRLVIELVYGVGHKLEEVADIMQCPVGTIKARLFHARVKLRNVLPWPAAPLHGDHAMKTFSSRLARNARTPGN